MTKDPSDFTTGSVAAAPIVDAIIQGDLYVITHGTTLAKGYSERVKAIDHAFSALATRQQPREDARIPSDRRVQ